MNVNPKLSEQSALRRYIGLRSPPRLSGPLQLDMLRQFALAVMDANPLYFDEEAAKRGPYGQIVAPPLFPLHMFRQQPGGEDPLAPLQSDPDLDGTGGLDLVLYGLPKIETDLIRLINGGNEVEFYRHLRLGERVRVSATYEDVVFKQSSKGPMIVARIVAEFETAEGQLLLINRSNAIHR